MDLSCIPLCKRTDIPDPGTREFSIELFSPPLTLFIVRQGDAVYAYVNRCPHTGVELNWQPNVFLDIDHQHLQCATHGALFRIEDGYCIYGPCLGASLTAVPLRIRKDMLYADANPCRT
jgi:nitrite reductase/ring-hydroxylating ferredoxin subunit